MSEESHMILQLLRQDPRYKLEAYQFVREGLSFGQSMMGLGDEPPSEDESDEMDEADEMDEGDEAQMPGADMPDDWEPPAERHLTGQELCQAIRHYAVDQYGLMAKVVLNSWGINSTSDLGELVYNLIRVGMMKKSKTDRREDFDNVFDFDEAFTREFQITLPD
jgi:uncharacterized repeat protein (TIGR04138 family)